MADVPKARPACHGAGVFWPPQGPSGVKGRPEHMVKGPFASNFAPRPVKKAAHGRPFGGSQIFFPVNARPSRKATKWRAKLSPMGKMARRVAGKSKGRAPGPGPGPRESCRGMKSIQGGEAQASFRFPPHQAPPSIESPPFDHCAPLARSPNTFGTGMQTGPRKNHHHRREPFQPAQTPGPSGLIRENRKKPPFYGVVPRRERKPSAGSPPPAEPAPSGAPLR